MEKGSEALKVGLEALRGSKAKTENDLLAQMETLHKAEVRNLDLRGRLREFEKEVR